MWNTSGGSSSSVAVQTGVTREPADMAGSRGGEPDATGGLAGGSGLRTVTPFNRQLLVPFGDVGSGPRINPSRDMDHGGRHPDMAFRETSGTEIPTGIYTSALDQSRRRPDSGVSEMPGAYLAETTNRERDIRNYRFTTEEGSKPKVMPGQFDGTGSWTDYLVHFDVCAQLNGWNEQQKAAYLAVSLRGSAQQLLGDLAVETRVSFHGLTSALAQRFDPANQVELCRVQLRSRVLEPKETLPELGQAIRRLTGRAYPGAHYQLLDTLARDYFIDALPDSDMRLRVYQAKPVTLDDAVYTSVELDAFQKAERQRLVNRKPGRSVNAIFENDADRLKSLENKFGAFSARLDKLTKAIDRIEKFTGKTEGYKKSGVECYACGEKGHFARDS